MNESTHPWDQLPDEFDSAYARFLAYLHLGPGRSIVKAQRAAAGPKPPQETPVWASGGWKDDCARHAWVKRSNAYDLHLFRTLGVQAALAYAAAIKALAVRVLNLMAKADPDELKKLLKSYNVLSQLIPPETLPALLGEGAAGRGGPPTAPAPALPAGTASLSGNEVARG
jgi:hypothetical protein